MDGVELTTDDLSVKCSNVSLCGNKVCAHNNGGYCAAHDGACYGFVKPTSKPDLRGTGSKENVGRKQGPSSKVISIRLLASDIETYRINGAWLKDAVKMKIDKIQEGEKMTYESASNQMDVIVGHKIDSENILTCAEIGRVIAVFYNDYDLKEIIERANSSDSFD